MRNHPRVTKGNHHQALNIIIPDHFLKSFYKKLDSKLPNILYFPRIHQLQKKNKKNKTNKKKIVNLLNGKLNRRWYHDQFLGGFLGLQNMIESKIYKSSPVKHKRKLSLNVCKLFFDSKSIGFINLPRTFSYLVIRSKIHK